MGYLFVFWRVPFCNPSSSPFFCVGSFGEERRGKAIVIVLLFMQYLGPRL